MSGFPFEHVNYIAVEGLPFTGKTEFVKRLTDRIGGRLVLDEADQNPFLEESIRHPKRFSLQTQLQFMLQRFKSLELVSQMDIFNSRVISDFLYDRNRIYATLNLSEKEFSLYQRIESVFEAELPHPDLVVFLQVSLDRIRPSFEIKYRHLMDDLPADFLNRLDQMYNEFFFHYMDAPLLIVNISYLDFLENDEDFEFILAEMAKHRSGQRYLIPRT